MFDFDRELLRLLPRVLRAREFHLYLEGGKRLTDLWLHGGRAILGHKPPLVLKELKNAAERGLFSPFPHVMESRLIKALGELFPGKAFRLYNTPNALHLALEKAKLNESASLWRPFVEGNEKALTEKAPVFVPVLPLPLGPEVLVLEKNLDEAFPPGELIPPVLLAAANRAIHNLIAALKAPNYGRQRYRRIEKALASQKEGAVLWQCNGIYLNKPTVGLLNEYSLLFKRFLEGGFLLPPSPAEPAILPVSMSDGEEAKLAELFLT